MQDARWPLLLMFLEWEARVGVLHICSSLGGRMRRRRTAQRRLCRDRDIIKFMSLQACFYVLYVLYMRVVMLATLDRQGAARLTLYCTPPHGSEVPSLFSSSISSPSHLRSKARHTPSQAGPQRVLQLLDPSSSSAHAPMQNPSGGVFGYG